MKDREYLVLLGNRNLKPLHPQFKELGAFYTGFCWAFPAKSEPTLSSIISHLPAHKIQRLLLTEGTTFESYRQTYKAKYLAKMLSDLDLELSRKAKEFSLSEFSDPDIEVLECDDESKQSLLDLLQRKEELINAISHAEGLEKALKEQKTSEISINFICEQEVNYLLEEAPEMPRLVNFIENGKQKPFIPKEIVAQLVGAGGVGKTHALAQLAFSIATGTNWLDIYPIEKPGYVFMGLGENKPDDIHRLLWKIADTYQDKNSLEQVSNRLSVMSFTGMDATFIRNGVPTVYYDEFLKALKEKEPKEGWSLIILDPISRFMGADAETDNACATQFISLLERITLELKGQPTLIFGHHMNKSGLSGKATDQGASRGSSAITDGVRWQANLEKVLKQGSDDEYELGEIILRPVKSNFTIIIPSQSLTKNENGCLTGKDLSVGFF